MPVHLEEGDETSVGDEGDGYVRLSILVLRIGKVQCQLALDLPNRAGGNHLLHRYPRISQCQRGGRNTRATRPTVGLQHFNEEVYRGPRIEVGEHDRFERLPNHL
ncbi:hypothetical protein AUH73_01770 [archaeon 13_1_40CM_4_53_4]|nr:MAG: hypothetical protein AUH73_01770 [archaeon 13_1_40CM_4_53_4]